MDLISNLEPAIQVPTMKSNPEYLWQQTRNFIEKGEEKVANVATSIWATEQA